MEQREKDGKFAKGDMEPKTLGGFDRERKWMTAEVVPHKGVNPYAVKAVSEEIENSGYSRIILKSGQEPSLLALLRTAKTRGANAWRCHPSGPQLENLRAMGA